MDISFTGINNLYIGKKAYSKFGTYLGEDRKLKQGKKFYTEIKMKCNLTNDAQGNDLEDFQKTLSKCRPCSINSTALIELTLINLNFT